MKRQHTHPCKTCGVPVSCRGQLEDNFDGWPPVVCVDYHLWWGEVADVFCEEHSNDDREELTAPDAWEGGFARNH